MERRKLSLTILSPDKTIFSGVVQGVHLPGSRAPFTVLQGHIALISSLQRGTIRWDGEEPGEVIISAGFVEVKNDVVTVCVEI